MPRIVAAFFLFIVFTASACSGNNPAFPDCKDGQTLVRVGSGWSCADPAEFPTCTTDQTLVWDGNARVCNDSVTLPTCTTDQVMAWIEGGWSCAVVVFGTAPFIDLYRTTLAEFSVSRDSDTRAGVASNPSTPAATLVSLALVSDPGVRSSVASNPNLPLI